MWKQIILLRYCAYNAASASVISRCSNNLKISLDCIPPPPFLREHTEHVTSQSMFEAHSEHALRVKRAKVPHLRSRLNGSIPSPSREGAEEATVPSKPTELSTVWGRLLCATVRVNRRLANFLKKEKASALYCANK